MMGAARFPRAIGARCGRPFVQLLSAAVLLASCAAPPPPRASNEVVRALLPSLFERACPAEGPRLERVDEQGGYTLWLSTPTRAGANRYLLDLEGSRCSLVVQNRALTPPNPALAPEEPYLYWPRDLVFEYAPGYEPPPPLAPDDPANLALSYINSEPLARRAAAERLADCEASAGASPETCRASTLAYFGANAVVLNIDLPGLDYPGGASVDVISLVPYWEGETTP